MSFGGSTMKAIERIILLLALFCIALPARAMDNDDNQGVFGRLWNTAREHPAAIVSVTALACVGVAVYKLRQSARNQVIEQPERSDIKQEEHSFIKIQEIPENQELKIVENSPGLIKDGFECLDLSKDEPCLMSSFQEIMHQKAKYGLPFILGVVSLMEPSTTKICRAYYQATGINNAVFGSIEFNNNEQKFHYYKNRLKLDQDKFRDPFCKLPIMEIQYFMINPRDGRAIWLAKDLDFFEDSLAQQFLLKLFFLHSQIDIELDKISNNPEHSLNNLYEMVYALGVLYEKEHYFAEAEGYYKLVAEQNADLEVKEKALSKLEVLYLLQKDSEVGWIDKIPCLFGRPENIPAARRYVRENRGILETIFSIFGIYFH